MKIDGSLIVRKAFEDLPDFFVIERAVHDGGFDLIEVNFPGWTTPLYGRSYFRTAWISTACVEGSGKEMRGIAKAIRKRKKYSAKRCAVQVEGDNVFLWSPRNSYSMGWTPPCGDPRGVVPLEVADALALMIEATLKDGLEAK